MPRLCERKLPEDYGEMEFSLRLVIDPVQVGELPNGRCSSIALPCACPWERMGNVHCVVRYLLDNGWEPGVGVPVLREVSVLEILLHEVKG
jgi:hypothetical protein